jgi:hypothetical protein
LCHKEAQNAQRVRLSFLRPVVREQLLDQLLELVKVDRLRNVTVAPGLDCFGLKVRRVVRGHRDDRR